MEKIQNLLNQVAIISDKNAEILDATGGRFNMFKVCHVDHYENTHSAIIAEFLNPHGSHGLKSKFLECFINMFCNNALKQGFDCVNARVVTEYSIRENGRIDILIEDRKRYAIIIENKIYASDQPEQLKRYNDFAQKYGKERNQIFYLTLWGNEASKQSGQDVDYDCISYKTDIIAWLKECVCIAVHHPMVRETINQYINHLKTLTNQDMDTKNKQEITELLCRSEENVKSAFLIAENLNSVMFQVVNKEFLPQLGKVLGEEFGEEIEYVSKEQDWSKQYCCFQIIISKCDYITIDFLFWKNDLKDLSVGIWYNGKGDKKCKDIFEKIKHKKYFRYDHVQDRAWNIFPEYRDWSKEAMLAIYNGKMADIFKDEIRKILELMKEI